MSVFALSMSKVQWLEKGARNCVVLAANVRPWIPMHQRWLEKGARNCVVLAAMARPWIPMHQLSNYILVFIFTFLVNNKTDCITIKYTSLLYE
jgi:hypothetical protein